MSNVNSILRRAQSTIVDTSGRYPEVVTSLRMESGIYTSGNSTTDDAAPSILQGRISLGILAAFILGAAGFYYYTRSIQGGG
jgi:hypothetical protein